MKNKLFIVVTCFLLLAIGGTAGAQPTMTSDAVPIGQVLTIEKDEDPGTSTLNSSATLSNRVERLNSFNSGTLLRGQRVEACGNGAIDEDVNGVNEECEFRDGVEITSPMSDTEMHAIRFPICNAKNGETCNRDTCRCEIVPICGDGIYARGQEQCEAQLDVIEVTPEIVDKMCLQPDIAVLNFKPKENSFTAPALAEGAHYVCNNCMCETCGNGVKDPGEECDGTQGCNDECKIAPQPAPVVKCTMVENGALESDYINELNAQARTIMSEAKGEDVNVDIFGESFHSEMLMQIEFPNSTVKGEVDASLQSKLAKSGNSYVTGTGIVMVGGPIPNDLSKVVQLTRESLQKPLFLFPRGSAGAVSKGKSLIAETEVIVPDMTASLGMDYETDLATAGLTDTEVVALANQGSLNGAVRFMVVPHATASTTKAEGQVGPELMSKTVILDAKAWFAPGGWGEQELIHHDPNEVLAALQEVVNELKAENRQGEIDCGIVNLVMKKMNDKGQKYEDQMVSKFAVISDTLKMNPATGSLEISDQARVSPAFFTVHTISGAGGAGTGPMSCSISAAQTHAPQIMITLGMLAVAITGVGIVRRRKRK